MAVIQSYGALQRAGETPGALEVARSSSGFGLDYGSAATYGAIYRTQPMVRTVVDYIARNIAQVGLHVYRRVSGTDRVRLTDHELALWLDKPNPGTCNFVHKERTFQDLGIYGRAYWLKVRLKARIGLVRLSPEECCPVGYMFPSAYVWTLPSGEVRELRPRDVVDFHYFDPEDELSGLSPLETLRQLLAEDSAARSYRRTYWANSARLEGVIERPVAAPKWLPEQKAAWREQWRAQFSGKPGQVAVLEDGMAFKPTTFSAQQSEFASVRKLTAEEVTRLYHCPLPMVGILEHATFSNIREQHKNLYQDCLGPAFEWLQQEIERQLLIECSDQADVYVEANVADKLKGSFEEQAAALQTAIGRPWMTANEGRARANLPAMKDDESADKLALPVNMSGALAPEAPPPTASNKRLPAGTPAPEEEPAARLEAVLTATWARQAAAVAKYPAWARPLFLTGPGARDWWDRELAEDLERAGLEATAAARLAKAVNEDTQHLLFAGEAAFDREARIYA